MTKQNFSSYISQALLNKVSFDFYENGQDTFKTRAKFYDKLIEEVVSAENKKRAFIAGGYFIKYKRSYSFIKNAIRLNDKIICTLGEEGCKFKNKIFKF